jgi:sugar phosphate permease
VFLYRWEIAGHAACVTCQDNLETCRLNPGDVLDKLGKGETMRSRWTRLLPVMMFAYIIAFMDRTNISFAIPTMGKDLHLSPAVLGFASGVLFLGYGISQTAGGWIADRGHGKALIAWLLVLWGSTEILQAFIETATQLILVRFALGFLEGGIFPAMLLFVRNWFAPSERARANGVWQLAYPLAAMLNGPIAGYILGAGTWRTLFIIEGIFPIVWVIVWLWGVAESPSRARWLTGAKRDAIIAKLEAEAGAQVATQHTGPTTVRAQLSRRPVLLFCASVFLWNIGFLGFIIWLPSVLHQDASLDPATIGWLSALPFAAAIVVMQLVTMLSDRSRDRRLYSVLPILICGASLAIAGFTYAGNGLGMNMLLLTTAGAMLYGSQPVLWSIPADIVPARVVGTIMGIMNTFGVLGAFVGPYLVGYVRGITGTFASGLVAMGACLALSSLLIWMIREAAPVGHHSGSVASLH